MGPHLRTAAQRLLVETPRSLGVARWYERDQIRIAEHDFSIRHHDSITTNLVIQDMFH